MLAFIELLLGRKKPRKNLSIFDKAVLGFAFGAFIFAFGMIGFVLFMVVSIQNNLDEINSPIPSGWEQEAERQRQMVIDLMSCDEPIGEPTQGIVTKTTEVQWSCTGYCGEYDLHYYEKLSDGTTTSICSGDYVQPNKNEVAR